MKYPMIANKTNVHLQVVRGVLLIKKGTELVPTSVGSGALSLVCVTRGNAKDRRKALRSLGRETLRQEIFTNRHYILGVSTFEWGELTVTHPHSEPL